MINFYSILGSENLFSALLLKCEEKNVMAICVVTFREKSASYLNAMIPNMAHGGFYAYKLPFAGLFLLPSFSIEPGTSAEMIRCVAQP